MVKMTVRFAPPDRLEVLAPPSSFEAALPVFPSQRRGIPERTIAQCRYSLDCCKLFARGARRRGGPKTVRYPGIAMEQLDNGQLLSVNFTGVVPTDFPATQVPGVVTIFPDFTNPATSEPVFSTVPPGPQLQNIIKVTGFNIQDIRVTYTPDDDTLSLGIDQPQSINQPGEVIAGDSDNNGDWGTVNPAVLALDPTFPTRQPGRYQEHGRVPQLRDAGDHRPGRRRIQRRSAHRWHRKTLSGLCTGRCVCPPGRGDGQALAPVHR